MPSRRARLAQLRADRANLRPLPAGHKHGEPTTYAYYGCRCAECRRGYAAYRRVQRILSPPKPKPAKPSPAEQLEAAMRKAGIIK